MKTLTVNVHYKCNAKCIFCVVGIPNNMENTNSMSIEDIEKELKRGRDKGCDSLCISGGEPTIYPGISSLVRKAKEMGYLRIEMKTNGIMLANKEFVNELARAGLDIFCISLQGHTAEIHDKVVGIPGAFSKVENAVKHVKDVGKILYTPTCIQQENYKFLPEIAEYYKKIGSDIVCPTFIEPSGSANINFYDVVPKYSDVIPYLEKAIEIIKSMNISWNLHGFPLCIIRGYENKSLDVADKVDVLANTDIEDYSEYESKTYRAKDNRCKSCTLNGFCNGPWKSYVNHYGFEEFQIEQRAVSEIMSPYVLVKKLFAE